LRIISSLPLSFNLITASSPSWSRGTSQLNSPPPEELEIYEKCYRFFKRTSSKIIRDYTAEQILRRAANLRGEK
jgi:hypothetical protein